MTTEWIARRLEVPDGVTKIMIPGLCQGELDVFDVPAEKGPADYLAIDSIEKVAAGN